MMNYKKRIDALYKKMDTLKDIADIVTYFLDHLGEDRQFTDMGEMVYEHPVLESLVEKCVERMTGGGGAVTLILKHINHRNFFHGAGMIGDKHITVLFFEDSMMGVIARCTSLQNGYMDFYRIRGIVVD